MKRKLLKRIRIFFAKLGLNDYCPICGRKMKPQGYYGDKSYCPYCSNKRIVKAMKGYEDWATRLEKQIKDKKKVTKRRKKYGTHKK